MTTSPSDKTWSPQAMRLRFVKFWREGHQQARKDIRARWRTGIISFLFAVWLSGLSASIILLATLRTFSDPYLIKTSPGCQPDNRFGLYPDKYQYWSPPGLFQITLSFGVLSFTQAKVIDVVWDTVCGRGGQAVIAFISWHVFAKYVTTSMEIVPVTYITYRTVFLQNESVFFSILRLIREFTCRRGFHSKVATAFMIATMVFIWIFATFASALTGYSASVKPYILDAKDNYIAFDGFRRVLYIVQDGWRINKTEDYVLPYDNIFDEPVDDWNPDRALPRFSNCADFTYNGDKCFLYTAVQNYTSTYGFFGLQNITSTFNYTTLPPPTLNISAFYIRENSWGAGWTDPRTGSKPFKNESHSFWIQGSTSYTMAELGQRGECKPAETYQWGFSFIQLNIMLIMCILWTIGILTMWTQAHFAMWTQAQFTMSPRDRSEVAGEYKAVLELANALNTQLLKPGETEPGSLLALPEKELCRRVAQDARGGSVAYEKPLLAGNAWREFMTVIRKEVWWIVTILALFGAMIDSFFLNLGDPWTFCGAYVSFVITVFVGTSRRSRAAIFLWVFLILCGVPLLLRHTI